MLKYWIATDCYFATKVWFAQQAGAAAVLVADDKHEKLITMDSPEDDPVASQFLENITIPSALITKDFGDSLKRALSNKEMVSIKIDWREALPHPDKRVEYEFWTNSNDECGPKCDAQVEFVRNYKGVAQILEQGGYTQFTPHYITWYCPQVERFRHNLLDDGTSNLHPLSVQSLYDCASTGARKSKGFAFCKS